MRHLKVVLVALLFLAAARAQQQPAFKPYAARDVSDSILASGGATAGLEGDFDRLVRTGIESFGERKYAEALELFKRAVNTPPESVSYNLRDAHYCLAVTYEALGRREEAIAAYQRAEKVRLTSVWDEHHDFVTRVITLYNLANLYADSGQQKEAVVTYKRVAEAVPDAATPHYNMGLSYAALGETQNAVDAFARAVKLRSAASGPEENKELAAKMHYNLGVAQGAAGRYGAAAEAFKEAVRLVPEYAEAHYNLGVAYRLLGDRESARRQQEILSKVKPQFAGELKEAIK